MVEALEHNQLLSVKLIGSSQSISAISEPRLFYLLALIEAPKDYEVLHTPLNLALVIDRSTSMAGDRIEQTKRAVLTIIESLRSDDIVSVVVFGDWAEIVVPASQVSSKRALTTPINRILTGGGTEIFQGLDAGVNEIRRSVLKNYINHVILFTDGQTYGDERECLQLAKEASAEGIDITAFGLGTSWNDRFLDELVAYSGGESVYVESPIQVVSYLQRRIRGLGNVYASDVKMTFDLDPEVKIKSVYKVAPFAQPLFPDTYSFRLGPVEGNAQLSILVELSIQPSPAGSTLKVPLKLAADIPSKLVNSGVVLSAFEIGVVEGETNEEPPAAIVSAVRALNFHRMNDTSWDEIEAGNIEGATRRLRYLSSRLMEAGHPKLATQVQEETRKLLTQGTINLEGRKKLKYSTRALVTQTHIEDSET